MDDILIETDTEQICMRATISLLNFLGLVGYQISKRKAQIIKEEVGYLQFNVSKGQRAMQEERKEAVSRIAVPKTKRQLRGFLGLAGFCCIRIPNSGWTAKPLYSTIKGPGELLEGTPECQHSFEEIKKKLMEAPALGLPDMTKPFQLYVHEKQHVASGLRSWKRSVAYFSKKPDEVSK